MSEKLRYGNEEKLYAIFFAEMKKIMLSLRETVSVLTPNWAIEEQFLGILEENKNKISVENTLKSTNSRELRRFLDTVINLRVHIGMHLMNLVNENL